MLDVQKKHAEFFKAAEIELPTRPVDHADHAAISTASLLIKEEEKELDDALSRLFLAQDPVEHWESMAEVCAEAVDLMYVVAQLLNQLGLPGEDMLNELHRANMRKVQGGVRRNAQGKILKPDGWKPANKLGVIMEAAGLRG